MRPETHHVSRPASSLGKSIYELMYRDIGKGLHIQRGHLEDPTALLPVPETAFDAVLKLGLDQTTRVIPPRVPDGVLHQHLVQLRAVGQTDLQRVRRRPFLPAVVVGRELRIFFEVDSLPERLDAGVLRPGRVVAVVARLDHGALEEDDGDHVLHAVVAVRRVVQRALLVDDDHGRLLGPYPDAGDVLVRIEVPGAQDPADLFRGFDAGGAVPFDRVDLEEDIFNHPGLEGARELEFVSFEEGVVEAPSWGRQNCGGSWLAMLREEGQVHGAHAGVASRPAFTWPGVGGLAKGA